MIPTTGLPHYLKAQYCYETFPKLEWCKVKKQVSLIYIEKILSILRPPK